MPPPELASLIGLWKVACFVEPDPPHCKLLGRSSVAQSLSNTARRGEMLRLVATASPWVLYGEYAKEKDSGFWIRCNRQTKKITIRARGELDKGGSYVLLMPSAGAEVGAIWKSLRGAEALEPHAIQWKRVSASSHSPEVVSITKAPPVPGQLTRSRGKGNKCPCNTRCSPRGSTGFVTVVRPKKKSRIKNKKRRLLEMARAKAQWAVFATAAGDRVDSLQVSTQHLHPFARQRWENLPRKQKRIKTFALPRADIEAEVDSREIDKYYYLVEELHVYVPKLTFQPDAGPRRTPRRQQSPASPSSRMLPREGQKRSNPQSRNVTPAPQRSSIRRVLPRASNAPSTTPSNVKASTAKQDENLPAKKKMRNDSASPGAAVIRDLRFQITRLRDELAAMKNQMEPGASSTDCPPVRPFFTERFHNQGRERHWTAKKWFGLTNSFPDLVQFVKAFHCEDALEEEHSTNKRSAPMTQFEQCLAAKVYLHTRQPRHVLAGLINCSVDRLSDAIDIWVPKWFRVAKALTRITWLGSCPKIFQELQPKESAAARRRRKRKAKAAAASRKRKAKATAASRDPRASHEGDSETASDTARADTGSDSDSSTETESDDDDNDDAIDFVVVCLDGKVFPLDKFNASNVLNRACFSSKTETSGLQVLVWSFPCGIPLLCTGLFGAKLSEKRQVQLHAKWLFGIPKEVSILQDRGFRKLMRYYPNMNPPIIPAATKWNRFHQLDEDEYTCSAEQARNRWPAEAIFGRVLQTPSLQGVIPHWFLPYVEQAHAVAYLNVLLCDFNVEPKGWEQCKIALDKAWPKK